MDESVASDLTELRQAVRGVLLASAAFNDSLLYLAGLRSTRREQTPDLVSLMNELWAEAAFAQALAQRTAPALARDLHEFSERLPKEAFVRASINAERLAELRHLLNVRLFDWLADPFKYKALAPSAWETSESSSAEVTTPAPDSKGPEDLRP